jgi:hypothetical protein
MGKTRRIQGRSYSMDGGMIKNNAEMSSWNAVYNMIETEGAKLTTVSLTSLVGFVFLLTIPDDAPVQFNDIPLGGPFRFQKEVRELVLKVIVVSPQPKSLPNLRVPSKKNPIEKATDTLDSILDEAKRQQQIYVDTLSPNGMPICPSIADVSIFDWNTSTRGISPFFNIIMNRWIIKPIIITK